MENYKPKHPDNKHLTDPTYGKPGNKQHMPMQEMTKPHVDSFNYMLACGINKAAQNIYVPELELPNKCRVSFYIKRVTIDAPSIPEGNQNINETRVFPAECRVGGSTYSGRIQVSVGYSMTGGGSVTIERNIGLVPVMVKSFKCNLRNMKPAELIRHGEEAEEMGGYFIMNGNERIIRMLILPRRNYPLALNRPQFRKNGEYFTEYAVQMRCVRDDQTAANTVLHYLSNGRPCVALMYKKQVFYVPLVLILKALSPVSDRAVMEQLIHGRENDDYYKNWVVGMLRFVHEDNIHTHTDAINYLGKTFKVLLHTPTWYTNKQVVDFLFKNCVLIHLTKHSDKFDLLVFITRKLFSFARGQCAQESPDNPMFHEVLLPGHLYQMALKDKLTSWLMSVRARIEKASKDPKKGLVNFELNQTVFTDACHHAGAVTRGMEYFIATGNLTSTIDLGLQQTNGLTVLAEKLNFCRYLSHFRCVHRGAFFSKMRTTAVRKLRPESWGFLCPVNTPDGAPCGLMNHLAVMCQIVNEPFDDTEGLVRKLIEFGAHDYKQQLIFRSYSACYPVMLDGRLVAWISDEEVDEFVLRIRILKALGEESVPRFLEICFVPKTDVASQFPGVYLFSTLARMMRPVKNLRTRTIEMIGSFEQVYLDIPISANKFIPNASHMEVFSYSMFSEMASLTPYSDFNQSPRNMYQCQMGKQTMGVPLHAWKHRADNKLYRLHTPQSPLIRTGVYDYLDMDNYPIGTNAVVAVISHTGYDMEDAMVLNKASIERGFTHGSIYKSEFIDLRESHGEADMRFGVPDYGDLTAGGRLDPDGLPAIGTYLEFDDPYYSYMNQQTKMVSVSKFGGHEAAYVDSVRIIGNDMGTGYFNKVCIVFRIPRNPVIGDKLSSRHGQKGILSQRWPMESLPFTESGMMPDILFNPHGFPSRMTIGMIIEFMAGKSAAMHGICHDATPFVFSEENPAIDYFGKKLREAGYEYTGEEVMYSGITGKVMEVSIFTGVVYYQRLRHMVSDKDQVRTTGPMDQITQQPVQGRKRGGGIRVGEMERDTLLAHGTAFLLHDRFFGCSDGTTGYVCKNCGSLLSPIMNKPVSIKAVVSSEVPTRWSCRTCNERNSVVEIRVPHVFKYLVAELASMNVATRLGVKSVES